MEFVEGDLFDSNWPTEFDTVLFSNILHIYNPQQNKILLKKIHRVLKQNGRVILVDLFMNKNKTTPYDAVCFSLTMLMFTETGKSYTFEETRALLKATGFGSFKTIPISDGTSVMEAKRS